MTTKLLGTYRGFRLFEALDGLGKPTGSITVEGLDGTFMSVANAQAAVDAHLIKVNEHGGEAEPDEPSYESPSL